MSELLESLPPPASRAACEANDVHQTADAGKTVPAHTPLPWRVVPSLYRDPHTGNEEIDGWNILDANGKVVCGTEGFYSDFKREAELAVRAVNSHAALVSEAATLRADLAEALEALRWATEVGRLTYVARTRNNGDYCDAVDRARSILNKHAKD